MVDDELSRWFCGWRGDAAGRWTQLTMSPAYLALSRSLLTTVSREFHEVVELTRAGRCSASPPLGLKLVSMTSLCVKLQVLSICQIPWEDRSGAGKKIKTRRGIERSLLGCRFFGRYKSGSLADRVLFHSVAIAIRWALGKKAVPYKRSSGSLWGRQLPLARRLACQKVS